MVYRTVATRNSESVGGGGGDGVQNSCNKEQ